jgi:DNA-binding NarL/FixJ family response regulator
MALPSMHKISILLADDHMLVRQGMRGLLNAQPDIEVIGEASDGYKLVELAEKLSPQVIITDIAMPNMNGLEAIGQIRKRLTNARVIILSMHSASSYVIRSLRSGALGYLLKNDDFTEVIQAIHAVVQGRRYLSAQISEQVIDTFKAGNHIDLEPVKMLTRREREILQLIAEGHTSLNIAENLYISIRTVEKHRANLRTKLGLTSQADVVHFAIQQGIVSLKE